jgi:hypothetical protein
MRSFSFIVTMWLAGAASAEETTVGVLTEAHRLSAAEAEALGDAIATAADELLPVRVHGPAELREMLEASGTKTPKTCKSKRCWLKVGKAAGLTAVLAVRGVAKKRGVALSFKWVDVVKGRVTVRHQVPIQRDVATFAEEVRTALEQLQGKLAGKAWPSSDDAPVAAEATTEEGPEVEPSATQEPERVGDAVAVASSVPERGTGASSPGGAVWLGVDLGRGEKGAVVRRVTPGGPAASAGLLTGDVIMAWDGWLISTAKDVLGFAIRTGPGGAARVQVSRAGGERLLSITPEEPSPGGEPDAYEMVQLEPTSSSIPARPADSPPR